jgi:hypothetical protein
VKSRPFAPVLVPGLLRTAEYARSVTTAMNPFASDEHIEDMVSVTGVVPVRDARWTAVQRSVSGRLFSRTSRSDRWATRFFGSVVLPRAASRALRSAALHFASPAAMALAGHP